MHTPYYIEHCMQDLLYRRMRSLANYEAANKKLEHAKSKGKAVAEVRSLCVWEHVNLFPQTNCTVVWYPYHAVLWSGTHTMLYCGLVPIPCCTVVWYPYHAVLWSGTHTMLHCGLVPIPCCTVVWYPYHAALWSGTHTMLYCYTTFRLKRINKLAAPNSRSFLRLASKVHHRAHN